MNVLITSAASTTAQIVVNALGNAHTLRLTDLPENAKGTILANELDHEADTDNLMAGIDAIVNIGYQGQSGSAQHLMDYATRRTYNLLQAASDARVSRYVNISPLRLYEGHAENLVVTERWRTDPPADDIDLLSAHMAEYVCKEFARDRLIQVVNLRLGWPFVGDSSMDPNDTAVVSHDMIGAAVGEALTNQKLAQWQDIHIQSRVDYQRFITDTAAQLLPELAGRLAQ